MTLDATLELLITQWQGAARLKALLRQSIDRGNDLTEVLQELDQMRTVDNAKGVWLDYLGVRMGVRRPATTSPADDPRWGFEGVPQARPFGVAPFRGASENAGVFPLNDEVYRLFLRARGVTLISDATFPDFVKAVRMIDSLAKVVDNRDMSVTIRTDEILFLQLADDHDCLPRTAGVRILYETLSAFGFEGAGVGFDQGPFRGVI